MTKQDFIDEQNNYFFRMIDKTLENKLKEELDEIKNGDIKYQDRLRIFLSDVKPKVLTERIKSYICDKLITKYKFTKEDILEIKLSSDRFPCILIDLKF